MTRWCPDCGDPHECTALASAEDAKTQIRLAEIAANRDVRVAELAAATREVEAAADVDIAVAELETDTARAEGEAAGMETVLDELGGGAAAPADPPAVVELVDDGQAPDVETDTVAPMPDLDSPEPARSRGGFWGDNYR